MPVLKVYEEGGRAAELTFVGAPLVAEVLAANGFYQAQPCGGRGTCGKCAVRLTGAVAPETDAERRAGTRLACQARLLGDCEAVLPEKRDMRQIETGGEARVEALRPMAGRYGAAVDIGTTTLALRLYDLKTGEPLAKAGGINPQTAVAADVMGRIGAALDGGLTRLQRLVVDALNGLVNELCRAGKVAPEELDVLTVTGNTTMLYLLTGQNPEALSHAPFDADRLYGEWTTLLDRRAYLPRCMSAFVGADIACAVLASGMCERAETALLVDVGTNGEIALWHRGKLLCSSTAAGPAFEGSGIHMGVSSVPGAIDRVWVEAGALRCHTIGDAPAVGVCGSGLVDAVAALLALGQIDETGAVEAEKLFLTPEVYLLGQDVRSVQLAKAAIAAGIRTMLETAGLTAGDVARLYIAGGFGSHLNFESATAIGLFPGEFAGRERVIGNAALAGAGMLLLDECMAERAAALAHQAEHVPLGGSSRFSEHYRDEMMFE